MSFICKVNITACINRILANKLQSSILLLMNVISVAEHSIQILEKAFLLGVKSNINTTSNITKAIGILNIQSGC